MAKIRLVGHPSKSFVSLVLGISMYPKSLNTYNYTILYTKVAHLRCARTMTTSLLSKRDR